MADDLHARLLEVVRERKRVAEAAASEDVAWHSPYTCWTGLAARVVALVITNDPATIIRHCDADLRRLDRHAVQEGNCPSCGRMLDDWVYDPEAGEEFHETEWFAQPWPCDDIRDLAVSYGVEVDGG